MKIKKAVIPVAGLGTRFLPATKTVPKELLPIVDIPTVQYVVQEAVDAGIQEVIFVTGRGKDGIRITSTKRPSWTKSCRIAAKPRRFEPCGRSPE
jgi:UTP-glucose-1-phosphate uridylyltransferase